MVAGLVPGVGEEGPQLAHCSLGEHRCAGPVRRRPPPAGRCRRHGGRAVPSVDATAGVNTSKATTFASGVASARAVIACPVPEPISTFSGASRPKTAVQSTRAPAATEVCTLTGGERHAPNRRGGCPRRVAGTRSCGHCGERRRPRRDGYVRRRAWRDILGIRGRGGVRGASGTSPLGNRADAHGLHGRASNKEKNAHDPEHHLAGLRRLLAGRRLLSLPASLACI